MNDLSLCPVPGRCSDYSDETDASLYWALYVLNRFANDANNIRNMAFFSAQELFLAEVDKIAKQIGEMEPGDMALKKVFKITSQALSFLGFLSGQVSAYLPTHPSALPVRDADKSPCKRMRPLGPST